MLAKYLDVLLKSGHKTHSDKELSSKFDQIVVLFRFAKDKDVFEKVCHIASDANMICELTNACSSTRTASRRDCF